MQRRVTATFLAVLALGMAAASARAAAPGPPAPAKRPPVVRWSAHHDLSPPLRAIPRPAQRAESEEPSLNLVLPGRRGTKPGTGTPDVTYALATLVSGSSMPSPGTGFEGIPNLSNRVPPDTEGAVGPHHYVQWINLSLAIWDKKGTLLYGPVPGRTLWTGFGGICETHDNGDPVVLYDSLADRWLASQLAFDWPANFHQCIAISQTGDPTGAWYRYDFPWSQTTLNDYPKFAVWPDAYYMAVNQFDGSTQAWLGQAVAAFERDKMLAGQPARIVVFDLFAVNPNFGGQLPADLDGPIPPPNGEPAWFVEVDDDAWGWPSDLLQIFKFHVDWTDTTQSTYGVGGNPDAVIDLSAAGFPFDSNMCNYSSACIPLPGGSKVDALSDRLMYRLAYRNYGTDEALTVNHTVDVDGQNHAGIRWYDIRGLESASPFVAQAGTVAPDADNRWMGSLASDGAGDMALGYSVAGTATFPSVRYSARLASDPPGTMPQAEGTIVAGAGSQTGASRWGDYSTMSIDPADDCTFWYTQEYYSANSPYGWQTRVGSFKFASCGTCPLVDATSLSASRDATGTHLAWSTAANATTYGVVEGDVAALQAGGFAGAVLRCLAGGLSSTSLDVTEVDPVPGNGYWYLVRGEHGVCKGTYAETAGGGSSGRDANINASPSSCP